MSILIGCWVIVLTGVGKAGLGWLTPATALAGESGEEHGHFTANGTKDGRNK